MNNAQTAANAINSQDNRSLPAALRIIQSLGFKVIALETGVGAAFEFEDGSIIRSDSARPNATWFGNRITSNTPRPHGQR
jgi:hypothetical protein